VSDGFRSTAGKVMPRQAAARFSAEKKRAGRTVVFTNGCFDLLHVGHVTYLEGARACGDVLIVGMNTDASIRRIKGAGRPVQCQEDRARVLAALACVDAVTLFDEDTPFETVCAIRPTVLAKGADYGTKYDVVGWDIVEAGGGRVERIPLVEGKSTSDLIRRLNGQA